MLLHGGLGDCPLGLTWTAAAFGNACFRVIGIDWREVENYVASCGHLYGPAWWREWRFNECLERARYRVYEQKILPALEQVIFGMGWESEYWDGNQPNFSRIIWAGHSAGANQAAFLLREFDGAGAILLSGGADPGAPDPDFYGQFEWARWVTDKAYDDRYTGLYHNAETGAGAPLHVILPSVMEVNGVARRWAHAYATGPFRQAYGEARGLVAFELADQLSGSQAHGHTRGNDPNDPENPFAGPRASPWLTGRELSLKKALMYLACRAGGVPVA